MFISSCGQLGLLIMAPGNGRGRNSLRSDRNSKDSHIYKDYPTPRNALSVCHVFYKHLMHTLTNLISECARYISDFRLMFRLSKNFHIFGKFSDFWKIFRFSENCQIFGKFSDFLKIFRFSENFQIFGKFSDFLKSFRFSKNFQIF